MTNTTHSPQQPAAPADLTPRRETATIAKASTRAQLKRLGFRSLVAVWRILPGWMKRLAVRLKAPRVSVGVCALARDESGRLLLAHHTYRRRPWGLPGGLIGRGEQPAEALARELREELGVAGAIGPLVHAETDRSGSQMTLYYAVTLHDAPVADGIEIDAFRYATASEARKLLGPVADLWLAALAERRVS